MDFTPVVNQMIVLRSCPLERLKASFSQAKRPLIDAAIKAKVITIDAAGYVTLPGVQLPKPMKNATQSRTPAVPLEGKFTPTALKTYLKKHPWCMAEKILTDFDSKDRKKLTRVLFAMSEQKQVQFVELSGYRFWALMGETATAPKPVEQCIFDYLEIHAECSAEQILGLKENHLSRSGIAHALLRLFRQGQLTRRKRVVGEGCWYWVYSRSNPYA